MDKPQILHRKQIDKKLWDALVQKGNGSLYSTYDYLSLCEGDWEALILMQHDQYICAAPFPYRKKIGEKYIYQSPIAFYFNFITTSGDTEVNTHFMNSWLAQLSSYNYVAKYFVKDVSVYENKLKEFEIIKHEGLQVNLQRDYQQIALSYFKDRKQNLIRAQKVNQVIKQSTDVELFCSFHQKYIVPKMYELHPSQIELMHTSWKSLMQNEMLEIYFVEENQEILAGTLIGKVGTALYELACFNGETGRKKYSNVLVRDYVIKKYAQTDYKYLDFGLLSDKGIDEFKKRFGAVRYPVYQFYKNHLPWFIRIPKAVLNFFKINTGANPY